MSRLTRDGTAEPVSRDQILRRVRGQGNIRFPRSTDHEQEWQPYPVDVYFAICDDHTYIHSLSTPGSAPACPITQLQFASVPGGSERLPYRPNHTRRKTGRRVRLLSHLVQSTTVCLGLLQPAAPITRTRLSNHQINVRVMTPCTLLQVISSHASRRRRCSMCLIRTLSIPSFAGIEQPTHATPKPLGVSTLVKSATGTRSSLAKILTCHSYTSTCGCTLTELFRSRTYPCTQSGKCSPTHQSRAFSKYPSAHVRTRMSTAHTFAHVLIPYN